MIFDNNKNFKIKIFKNFITFLRLQNLGCFGRIFGHGVNYISLRLKKHNLGKGAKSTRGLKWKIIYKRKFNSKSLALSYEYRLKKDKVKRKYLIHKY